MRTHRKGEFTGSKIMVKRFSKTLLSVALVAIQGFIYAFGGNISKPDIITDGRIKFACNLFNQVTKAEQQNVLVSPFSAYVALSMVANGAAQMTLKQMLQVLGFKENDLDDLNAKNQNNINLLISKSSDESAAKATAGLKIEVANAIFADGQIPFKQEFIDLCKRTYGAEARNLDFRDPRVISQINNWCSDKTKGKILNIVDKLEPEEKMVLLNAVYFKGKWASSFNISNTKPDSFNCLSGEKRQISMMHQLGNYRYMSGDGFQAISMPYSGAHQSMYVFLPNRDRSITDFESQLTASNWAMWMSKFSSMKVELSLPKFKVEFSKQLNQPLIEMGMREAFVRGRANFSKSVPPPYYAWISRVLQKTYMDVDEQGTEAAAVTTVIMGVAKAVVAYPCIINFRVDRPYVVAIVDEDTREILFLGAITELP